MDDLMNRSFRFDGNRSFSFSGNKFTRSNSFRLASEIGSSMSARFTTYDKISDSVRLIDAVESAGHHSRRSRDGVWRTLTKVFSLKKAGGGSAETPRRSSWRPDPNTRWPVQGW